MPTTLPNLSPQDIESVLLGMVFAALRDLGKRGAFNADVLADPEEGYVLLRFPGGNEYRVSVKHVSKQEQML